MNFMYRFMRFISGRYGIDRLFYVIFTIAAILAFLNCFIHSLVLQLLVYLLTFYGFFRIFSRNFSARAAEDRAICGVLDRLKKKAEIYRRRKADTTHIYKKCPHCKAVLRLPKRQGKHQTVCPKCEHRFSVKVK